MNLPRVVAVFSKYKCVRYNGHVSYVALVYNREMSFQAVCRLKFPLGQRGKGQRRSFTQYLEPKILCVLHGFEVAKDC